MALHPTAPISDFGHRPGSSRSSRRSCLLAFFLRKGLRRFTQVQQSFHSHHARTRGAPGRHRPPPRQQRSDQTISSSAPAPYRLSSTTISELWVSSEPLRQCLCLSGRPSAREEEGEGGGGGGVWSRKRRVLSTTTHSSKARATSSALNPSISTVGSTLPSSSPASSSPRSISSTAG